MDGCAMRVLGLWYGCAAGVLGLGGMGARWVYYGCIGAVIATGALWVYPYIFSAPPPKMHPAPSAIHPHTRILPKGFSMS
eukprot:453899-Prorocentrum_minimum.AAC.1